MFAHALRDSGVEAEAMPLLARGVTRKADAGPLSAVVRDKDTLQSSIPPETSRRRLQIYMTPHKLNDDGGIRCMIYFMTIQPLTTQ